MRLFPTLLLMATALVVSRPAPAQAATPASPPPKARSGGRITGTVVCEDTHQPARGAMLIVSSLPQGDASPANPTPEDGTRSVILRVGMDGAYTADHLAPGEYTAIAVLPGYLTPFDDMLASQMSSATPAEQRAILAKSGTILLRGAETEVLNVTLVRGAAISGRVLYSDGSPAAQVSIDLENVATKLKPGDKAEDSVNVGRMMRTIFTQQTLSTDDRGNFRVAGLQPGTYRVAAIQSLGASEASAIAGQFSFGALTDQTALHFYSGDTFRRAAAKTYELRTGDELTGLLITIPDRAFHRAAGSVLSVSGKPVNAGTVTLTDSADATDATLTYRATIQAEGDFVFPNVPSGTYTLAVKDAEYNPPYPTTPPPPGKPFVQPPSTSFAPATQSILVKDTDLSGLSFNLTQLPPDPKAKPKPTPESED